jgi:hypothetical protein
VRCERVSANDREVDLIGLQGRQPVDEVFIDFTRGIHESCRPRTIVLEQRAGRKRGSPRQRPARPPCDGPHRGNSFVDRRPLERIELGLCSEGELTNRPLVGALPPAFCTSSRVIHAGILAYGERARLSAEAGRFAGISTGATPPTAPAGAAPRTTFGRGHPQARCAPRMPGWAAHRNAAPDDGRPFRPQTLERRSSAGRGQRPSTTSMPRRMAWTLDGGTRPAWSRSRARSTVWS